MTLFEPAPQRRRSAAGGPLQGRTRATIFGVALAVASVVGLTLTVLPSNPLSVLDPYTMSSEIQQIADRIGFTDEGLAIFVDTRPELLDSAAFLQLCGDDAGDSADAEQAAVGCYLGGGVANGRIAVFRPTDDRLADQRVVTAAHELLHAAYARLTTEERAALDPLLEERWSLVAADDPIRASLASSVGSESGNRATEQFAYLGTTVADAFSPQLETFYARYFADRVAVVAAHIADQAVRQLIEADYRASADALHSLDQANANEAAQLKADRGQLDADRTRFDQLVTSYNARPAEERSRLYAVNDDGSFGKLYGDYLIGFADSFATRDAELTIRHAALDATEANGEQARAELELIRLDLEALAASSVPSGR